MWLLKFKYINFASRVTHNGYERTDLSYHSFAKRAKNCDFLSYFFDCTFFCRTPNWIVGVNKVSPVLPKKFLLKTLIINPLATFQLTFDVKSSSSSGGVPDGVLACGVRAGRGKSGVEVRCCVCRLTILQSCRDQRERDREWVHTRRRSTRSESEGQRSDPRDRPIALRSVPRLAVDKERRRAGEWNFSIYLKIFDSLIPRNFELSKISTCTV